MQHLWWWRGHRLVARYLLIRSLSLCWVGSSRHCLRACLIRRHCNVISAGAPSQMFGSLPITVCSYKTTLIPQKCIGLLCRISQLWDFHYLKKIIPKIFFFAEFLFSQTFFFRRILFFVDFIFRKLLFFTTFHFFSLLKKVLKL